MTNGTNSDGTSKGRILGLIGILGLIALGAGAYWFMSQSPATTAPNIEMTTPTVTPMTSPSEPVVNVGGETPDTEPAGTRRGIVLQDDVSSFEKEFDDKSTKMEALQTGDQVTIYDRKWKGAEGGDSAYLAGREKKGWVDGKYILSPDEVGALDIFISSTPPLAELMRDTPQSEKEKLAVLDSKEFLLRCAHNPRPDSAAPCIRRYFYSAPTGAVLRWMELAVDEKIADKSAIKSEQFPVFANAVNVDPGEFAKGYQKLPDDLKKVIWESNCGQLAASPEVFMAATKTIAKANPAVFDSYAVCINELIANNRSDYTGLVEMLKKEFKSKTFTAKQRKAFKL